MRRKAVRFLIVVAGISAGHLASAGQHISLSGDSALQIMPIVGFETVYRDTPTPHTSTNFIYGLRLGYGTAALTGEAEYTRGTDTENYTTAPQQIKHDEEKLKLGIRSTYHFNEYMFVSGRLGGQANQGTIEETNSGVVTTKKIALEAHPYAGVALGVHVASFLTISAGTTVVFRDSKDMTKNEVQNVLAISVGIN